MSIVSRRGFLQALAGCVAASTCLPVLERAMAAVEPMVARAAVWGSGGAYLDMASANAMLKELYSPAAIENFAYTPESLREATSWVYES